jgi:hypothetical protein
VVIGTMYITIPRGVSINEPETRPRVIVTFCVCALNY